MVMRLDRVLSQAIHDPEWWPDNLTVICALELRHNSTGLRKSFELFDGFDNLGGGESAILGERLASKGVNGLEIFDGLIGPDNVNHRPRRFLTSSWGVSWPASA